jgi:predicted metal-dependent enzyme (double-stranded beta helix superfamily)
MATSIYTLQDFVAEAKEVVARGLDETHTIEAMSVPLARIIARKDCLADLEASGNPDPDKGFTIYQADDLTILAVVWPVNGGAPIHNHNGWALEGIVSGMERNRNYARLDDGSTPWYAKLEEVDPTVVRSGETTSLALPPNDIHSVEVPEGKTLAVHVYGLDLLKQWRYRFNAETGEVTPFRRASSV